MQHTWDWAKKILSMFPVVNPKTAMPMHNAFLKLILSIEKQQYTIFLSIEQEDIHTQTII